MRLCSAARPRPLARGRRRDADGGAAGHGGCEQRAVGGDDAAARAQGVHVVLVDAELEGAVADQQGGVLLVGEHERLHLSLGQRLDHRAQAAGREPVHGGDLHLLHDLGALAGLVLGDELAHAALDRLAVGTRGAAAPVHGDGELSPLPAGAVGQDLAGPDVAGDEHEAGPDPPRHGGDPGGDVVGVLHPGVLDVVLVAVLRPAPSGELVDAEGLPLDDLLLVLLAGPTHEGDVGAHPVGHHHDVRDTARQLPQDREEIGLRLPGGELAQRCVDEGLVEHHAAVCGHDQRAALRPARLPAVVGLERRSRTASTTAACAPWSVSFSVMARTRSETSA